MAGGEDVRRGGGGGGDSGLDDSSSDQESSSKKPGTLSLPPSLTHTKLSYCIRVQLVTERKEDPPLHVMLVQVPP